MALLSLHVILSVTAIVGQAADPKWDTLQDKVLACTSEEYKGDLGKTNAQDCLTSASNQNVNYAVWRGDSDSNCYVCLITERGDPSTWKYNGLKGAVSFSKEGAPPAPAPTPLGPTLSVGGMSVMLWPNTFTVHSLNVSVPSGGTWGKANNFSFVPTTPPRIGCHNLGDITIRAQPAEETNDHSWAIYSSASATGREVAPAVKGTGALSAHDITSFLNSTNSGANPFFSVAPVRIVRAYEEAPNQRGLILRFNITNTWTSAIRLGGLGLAMPQTGQRSVDIEHSVWSDPHIGGDHGFVEWVRVVVDERTLLAVPHKDDVPAGDVTGLHDMDSKLTSRFEAWRPIMEDTCSGGTTWEFTTLSKAWAAEWAEGKQFPYLWMSDALNKTGTWPNPKTPWPAWTGSDTVPVTDHAGVAQPWNTPSARVLAAGETISVAIRLLVAEKGPRTRNAALAELGKAVLHAVPGYVLSPQMKTARLFVLPPKGSRVAGVSTSDKLILQVSNTSVGNDGYVVVPIQALSRGRCRVSIAFDDGTVAQVHYMVLPAFDEQVRLVGQHWANDAWLPRNYPDPFGRSASVMPYDRERRGRVMDDARAYDVGLSDDAGGGNPLGFAMKVGHAPLQDEVTRVDDYIKWTLYGVKPDTAKEPLKSLQIRYNEPGMESHADGIRMTMYYYDNAAHPSKNWSGHFSYDYKEQDKCGHIGIEGGPNWCMSEDNANATYRAFNFPHHTASYYAMYRVARNHVNLTTYHQWQWYLERAANTTIKFGSPKTGVMDGTVFREILRSIKEEASMKGANPKWATLASQIDSNMRHRAEGFAAEEYPYGSEFSFDTTGQEEVVVWLMYFADNANKWNAAAERTVDHILSYMRSSPTWPYHGGTRSWGDLGNNGKWMVSSGTGFETRGNLHYRSGLNMIPLIEWYRANPDDFFLLEVSMGALAGQMANIDEMGAPSMMLHMLPHVLDFDPHSGDFGLGFFGHTLEAGAYLVQHPQLGTLCYLCDLMPSGAAGQLVFEPRDSYRQRIYLEPLGLYLQTDAGLFKSISLDMDARRLEIQFDEVEMDGLTFVTRRLRLNKEAMARPGTGFKIVNPSQVSFARGAFEMPAAVTKVLVQWEQETSHAVWI